jgi:hypothetical protein
MGASSRLQSCTTQSLINNSENFRWISVREKPGKIKNSKNAYKRLQSRVT